jgi:hypothetical protein
MIEITAVLLFTAFAALIYMGYKEERRFKWNMKVLNASSAVLEAAHKKDLETIRNAQILHYQSKGKAEEIHREMLEDYLQYAYERIENDPSGN